MAEIIPMSGHTPPSDDPLILDRKAPLDTARTFVERGYVVDGSRLLQHQQNLFSKWIGTHYQDVFTEEMRGQLYEFLDQSQIWVPSKKGDPTLKPFNPTARHVSDVVDAMRAVCQLASEIRQPAWLTDHPDHAPPSEVISCANGLLHLPTGRLFPHTPNFYCNTALEYNFDPKAPEPQKWLQFLSSIWPTDIDARATLQDIFGYLLGTDTDQQKIPLLVGPKRSGKGTIGRILSALVGQSAVVSPTLASLESNFGLAPLIGKRIAVVSDARLGGRADQQVIAERLLSISGEDAQTIDRKHIAAWTGRLPTRFFIMSNELPRLADASGALASRFLVLTMDISFYGSEDHGLTPALMQELPGILNWAIAGWRNMRARGYFMPPASSMEAIREIEDLSSPISAFIRERCVVEPGRTVSVDGLYHEWREWCEEQGRDHKGTKATLGKDLRAAIPGIGTGQPRDGDNRAREYRGIGLQSRVIKNSQNRSFDDL